MAKMRHASEKYVDNALEAAKAYTDSQRLGYEEERCLISSKEIKSNDGEFGFYIFPWDDSSIVKNDGDILKLHITSSTGEEEYPEISLYNDGSTYGTKFVVCFGKNFGYQGQINDNGDYIGLCFVAPEGNFLGTLEVYDTVITQIDEKFIPNSIAKKSDIVQSDYNQSDETAMDFIKNRPFYKEERILVSQKPLFNVEEDFRSSDYIWDDTSLKLNDGDIIKLHISDNLTDKDASIEVSLYYMSYDVAPWGDRQFEIPEFGGAVFGYVGTVDDEGHYNGVRIIVPPLFDGAIEISDLVGIKQLDEKFIPDTIARKEDVTIEEWEYLGYSTNEGDFMYLAFPEPFKAGEKFKVICRLIDTNEKVAEIIDTFNGYTVGDYQDYFYFYNDHLEGNLMYSHEVYKQVTTPIKDKVKDPEVYEFVKMGESESWMDSNKILINCPEDILEGDTIMLKGYFEDGIETHILENINIIVSNGKDIIANSLGRLGDVYLDGAPNLIVFNSTIKGEVYKYKKSKLTQVVEENKYTYKPFKIGEGTSTEEDIIPDVKNLTVTYYIRGPAEEEAIIGNNSSFMATIAEKIPTEYAETLIGKWIQIHDISAQEYKSSIMTAEICGIGEDYSTLFFSSSTFQHPSPFMPRNGDKIYSAKLMIKCSTEIKEGDILLLKSYFEDDVDEYTIVVPKLNTGAATIGKDIGGIGKIDLIDSNHDTVLFTYGTKGVIYKLSKFPIIEGVAELYDIVNEIDTALDRVIEKYGLGGE